MNAVPSASEQPFSTETRDFSLVLGGPLFQIFRRTRLAGDVLQLLRRRIVVIALLAWLPLLLLSLLQGQAWGGIELPFLQDIEMQVRLLIALPLLVAAEWVVHQRMQPVVGLFLERALIPPSARAQFDAAVGAALRLRNSVLAEVLMLALVYGVGVLFVWRSQVIPDVHSWYGVAVAGQLQPTPAGWWMGCVSLPLFQFLLLRWYFRIFIWARFLWQVSRIELNLIPTQPDGCGGLSFLAGVSHAFAPVLLAQGAVLAGMMADRILFAGATLPSFKVELIALAALMVLAILGPLLVFAPQLAAAKRTGLREYGSLAQRYVREFDRKWLRGGAPADEALIGSADIQSLTDLAGSLDVIKGMRIVPFTWRSAVQLAFTTVLPVAPLLLTMFSFEQLLERLLKVLF